MSPEDKQLYIRLVNAGKLEQADQLVTSYKPQAEPEIASRVPYGAQAGIRMVRGAADIFGNLAENLMMIGGEEEAVKDYRARQDEMYNRLAPDAGEGWETGGAVLGSLGAGGALKGTTGALERLATMGLEGGMFGATAEAETPREMGVNVGIGTGTGVAIPGTGMALSRGVKGIPAVSRRLTPVSKAGEKAEAFVRTRRFQGQVIPLRGEDVVQSGIARGSGRYLDAIDPTNTRAHDLKKSRVALQAEFGSEKDIDTLMKELGESYTRTYKALQTKKKALYRNAYKSTGELGDVNSDRFRAELLEQYQKQVNDFGAESPGAKEIEKWFDYGEGSVETWHNRMKDVSRRMRSAQRSADPNTVSSNVLGEIKDSLVGSINRHTGDNKEWQTAQAFYAKNIVPYRQDAFNKLVRKGDTEAAALQAVDPSKTRQTADRADRYWSSLDTEGRAKYKETLLAKMLDQGSDAEIPFSSAKASSYLDATDARLADKYIGKAERAALDGWQNLLRVSQFSGESAARSRTGASLLQSLAGPAALATGGAFAGGVPGAVILGLAPAAPAIILRSAKVRGMLAKLGKMEPQHPDYDSLVKDTVQAMTVAVSTYGINGELE